jgi:hypothetical protein
MRAPGWEAKVTEAPRSEQVVIWREEFMPAGQSFGTQPLPGMNSRLPEWVLQPAQSKIPKATMTKPMKMRFMSAP